MAKVIIIIIEKISKIIASILQFFFNTLFTDNMLNPLGWFVLIAIFLTILNTIVKLLLPSNKDE